MSSIVTPVRPERLNQLLTETCYDPQKTQFLVEAFTHGFKLGYEGPEIRQTLSRNHRLRAGDPTVHWNKIMKEVKNLRMTGPHLEPPYENFIQSPSTLIPKKGSNSSDPYESTCLIIDLSWPHGSSLNDYTPQSVKSVEYCPLTSQFTCVSKRAKVVISVAQIANPLS